jgi:two-component system, OmpR family, phosphate regulon sensor histidine kinase PhoR
VPLRSRLAALFGILAAAAAFFLVVVSDATIRRAVEDRATDRITRELELLSGELGLRPPENEAARDTILRRAARDLECRITFIASDGRVESDTDLLPADVPSMENHAGRPEVRDAREKGFGQSRRSSPTERQEFLYVAKRLADGNVLRVAVPAARVREVATAYLWTTRVAIVAVCLAFFVIGAAASRRFSEPIAELTRAASAVAAGDFARELPSAGGEEVQLLSAAMRRMKASLAEALTRAQEERRLTSVVFERLPDALVVVDAKLQVVESNDCFARMIGISAPAGRALYDLLRNRSLYDAFDHTMRTGEPTEKTVRLADEIIWAVAVQSLPAGARAAAVGVLRDVTRLERTEAMRRTFVADVSHELRTPIASIAAAAETLAEGGGDESETSDLVALVGRQSARMRELIDDLMDLAQIESGAVELKREGVPLVALLREVAGDLSAAAAVKNVPVVVTGDETITAWGDRRRLGQIARNLLDNAIKFSPDESPVSVRVEQTASGSFFSVTDQGVGIPKSERDKIFQRFYQIDRSRSKVRPGTGLGLAIVKHLAHLHGAAVEVEGEVGRGSTFRVQFPAAPL